MSTIVQNRARSPRPLWSTATSALRRLVLPGVLPVLGLLAPSGAHAETLREALQRTHRTNPVFLAQRHSVPAAEAGVDRARAGYLPRINASADYGLTSTTQSSALSPIRARNTSRPKAVGLDVTQTLFDGARTYHAVGQANQQLSAAQQTLRDTEQIVLLDAVTAYVDVLRDQTILKLERQSLASLSEQLRRIRELYGFGDVTQTDVVQVQARVADSRARVSGAEAALKGSEGVYELVVGAKPVNLSIPRPADRLAPASLEAAMAQASLSHPSVLAALASATAAEFQVKVALSEHSPIVSVTGSLAQQFNTDAIGDHRSNGSVYGRLSVPIFSGGETVAKVREARENASRRRLEADAVRAQVRAGMIRAWSQYQSSKIRLSAAQEQVLAASAALKGVREEFGLGQRTATNVLDAVQDLLSASVNLASAQRERIVTTYSVSRAVGKLSIAEIDGGSQGTPQAIVDQFAQLSVPVRRNANIANWQLRAEGSYPLTIPEPRAARVMFPNFLMRHAVE